MAQNPTAELTEGLISELVESEPFLIEDYTFEGSDLVEEWLPPFIDSPFMD